MILFIVNQIIQTEGKPPNSLPFHLENGPNSLQWPIKALHALFHPH